MVKVFPEPADALYMWSFDKITITNVESQKYGKILSALFEIPDL